MKSTLLGLLFQKNEPQNAFIAFVLSLCQLLILPNLASVVECDYCIDRNDVILLEHDVIATP